MILNFKKKEEIVEKLTKNFDTSLSAIVASIHGITSNSINRLRKEARDVGVCIRVAPNSLLRRAVLKTSCTCLSEFFVGNSIIAFSIKNPSDAIRIFVKFSKDHEDFKIKGVTFENKLIKLDQIDILANLPDYKESVIQLIFMLKVSSIGRLINVLLMLSNRAVKL